MIIRVEISSLNEDQENLDNSWLLGENNIANTSIELDKTNDSESTFFKYLEQYTSEEEDILPDGE